MKRILYNIFLIALLSVISCGSPKTETPIRLNNMQLIGSHNSYKQRIDRPIWEMIYQEDSALAVSLDYSHIPLVDQLVLGLRALELDVFHDPEGGRFAHPLGLQMEKDAGFTPPPFDVDKRLAEPGLKLFHIQDLDFRSDFVVFKDALKALKKWSAANPDHLPIFITINAKDEVIEQPGFTKPLPFTKSALDSIDIEISDVFTDEQLITPDLVRGKFSSLEQAILTDGWPILDNVSGRFMFILDEKGKKRDNYVKGHKALTGRKMFVSTPAGTSESAFVILNYPIEDYAKISKLVEQGYMVRTRADESSTEARNNDYRRFQMAVKSGAQIISTDYYVPDTLIGTGFKITFEDGNPYSRHIE